MIDHDRNTKYAIRHPIRCNCILQQDLQKKDPPNFHFLVLSIIENNEVISKIVQCPSCGILHRVTDICKSNILLGREDSKSVLTIEEIKSGLPENLVKLLSSYELDMTQWELASFIIDNERWGDVIVLTNEVQNDLKSGKYVRILGKDIYKIETFEVQI